MSSKTNLQISRKKMKWWYFFLFANIVVLVWGAVFLCACYNGPFQTYKIYEPLPTLLTVIGFLFAFAGINIYSIFNTNIETEKKTLNDLSEEYRSKLERAVASVEHSKIIVRIHINIGLIVDPLEAPYEIQDLVDTVLSLIEKATSYIKESRTNNGETSEIEIELRDIAQYNHRKLNSLFGKIRLEHGGAYFRKVNREQNNVIRSLEKLKNKLDDIISGSVYEPEVTEVIASPESFCSKLKSFCGKIKSFFSGRLIN